MAELASKLPKEYEYAEIDKSSNLYQLRVKNVKSEEDVNVWLDSYSEITMTTWRVRRTFPRSGKVNIFKKYFRCQHKTDGRHRGLTRRASKNTDCPAQIEILIKRCKPHFGAAPLDKWIEEFPTFVRFRNDHNHKTSDAVALKHRDMSVDTREKLFSLFRAGHLPSSARNFLKMELLLNYPDSYKEKLADAHYVPSLATVARLYKTVVDELDVDDIAGSCMKVTARELKIMMGDVPEASVQRARSRRTKRKHVISSDEMLDAAADDAADDDVDDCILEQSLELPVVNEVVEHCSYPSSDHDIPLATDWCCNVVDQFCMRVKQCITDNPQSFVPAVEKMHQNLLSSALNDEALLATLYTMAN